MKKIALSVLLTLFFTLISFSQIIESFEGNSFPPPGWTIFGSDNGNLPINTDWVSDSSNIPVCDGNKQAFVNGHVNIGNGNTMYSWLVSPQILINNSNNLNFCIRKFYAGNENFILKILLSTSSQTDISTFSLLQTFTETQVPYGTNSTISINLDSYSNQSVYIAFVFELTQTAPTITGGKIFIDNVMVDGVLNRDNFENSSIKIYPNPLNNILNIDSSNIELKKISIYNTVGQLIKNNFGYENTIDVSNLKPGTYFIKIETSEGKQTQKFIKI